MFYFAFQYNTPIEAQISNYNQTLVMGRKNCGDRPY